MMWFKSVSKQPFRFPDLEDKLAKSRKNAKRQREKLHRTSDAILYHKEARQRLSAIGKRNKPRTILVIGENGDNAPVVKSLLGANTNASPSFVSTIEDAIELLKSVAFYDMIYLIKSFGSCNECSGPCFFSLSDTHYAKRYSHLFERDLKYIQEYANDAEVIVVCGEQSRFIRRDYERYTV